MPIAEVVMPLDDCSDETACSNDAGENGGHCVLGEQLVHRTGDKHTDERTDKSACNWHGDCVRPNV